MFSNSTEMIRELMISDCVVKFERQGRNESTTDNVIITIVDRNGRSVQKKITMGEFDSMPLRKDSFNKILFDIYNSLKEE